MVNFDKNMNWTKQKLNTEVKFDFLVGDIGFWSLGGVGGIFYVDFWNLKKESLMAQKGHYMSSTLPRLMVMVWGRGMHQLCQG